MSNKAEQIGALFALAKEDYPNVSHILGSDWIAGLGWQGGDPQYYRFLAMRTAKLADEAYICQLAMEMCSDVSLISSTDNQGAQP